MKDKPFRQYPHNSPYAVSENRLIDGVELEGAEFLGIEYKLLEWAYGKEKLQKTWAGQVAKGLHKHYSILGMSENATNMLSQTVKHEANEWQQSPVKQTLKYSYFPVMMLDHTTNTATGLYETGKRAYQGDGEAQVDVAVYSSSALLGLRGLAASRGSKVNIVDVVKRGELKITAKNASISEVRAANYMRDKGFNVELRDPVGTRAGGGTSDLLVDGVAYDVYTPISTNPNRIVSAVAKKNTQASGVVLDLTETTVTQSQLGDVLKRVQGAGATNITDIQIIGGN